MDYAGDLSPTDTWKRLEAEPDGVLIDVRTKPEWEFVGVPDLSPLDRSTVLISWKRYPDMSVNPGFVDEVRAAVPRPEAPLYFLCRSGQRSRDAAVAATAGGYRTCYNVADGFEGPLDGERHRAVRGWKAEGLPWVQG